VLLLATVALTGCRLAEHGRRAAIDAFASFVLDSVFQAPLTQPAPKVARVGQALLPVLRVPPPEDRHECLSYTEPLPPPRSRIASIDLVPAAPAVFRRVKVRMALAELRGLKVRRIVVVM
jgi:hypothetical protein